MNRELNFIFTKFRLGLLENREYKINLIFVFLFDFSIIFGMIILFLVLEQASGNIINWNVIDYIGIIILAMFNGKFQFSLTFRALPQMIKNGELNVYLTKPINTFYFLLTRMFSGANNATLVFLWFPITIIYSISQENTLLGLLLFVFGLIHCMLLFQLSELISFFTKDNSFLKFPIRKTTFFFEKYNPLLLQQSSIFYIMGFIPSMIYGFLVIEVFRGNFQYLIYLNQAFISVIILIIINYILYTKGIKNYEAFS